MAQEHHPNDRHPVDNSERIRTLVLVTGFILIGFGCLVAALYNLQILNPETYRVEAAEQQISDETIPATRGAIYTATGQVLAKSSVVWNIVADPSKCNQAFVEEAADTIAGILDDGTTAESILANLQRTDSKYRVIARGVDKAVKDAILEYAATKRWVDENGNPAAEGAEGASEATVLNIYTEQSSTRDYPYGAFLASVLGFCNADGEGQYGLEKSYEDVLAGTPGRTISTQNAYGYELAGEDSTTYDAIDGSDLHLTIDENIQSVLEEQLSDAVTTYNIQNRATAIVMNVNSGAVYGMATVPQFDPNDPNTIYDEKMAAILDSGTLTPESIATLQSRIGQSAVADIVADGMISDEEYSTLQGYMREAQWKNKAVTELYYPGSVFKLITAAAALDSGLVDASQSYYCSGELTFFPDTQWETSYHCAEGNTHTGMWLDMAQALNYSCNLYFVQLAEKMQPSFFYSYFQAFGLTEQTGIDLPGESAGISRSEAEMEQVATNLYSSAFGQSQKLTAIQMATAVSAVVNGGYLVTPYLVDYITDASGNITKQTETTIKRQVISEDVSAQLRQMMFNNVGTGDATDISYHGCKSAYVAGYLIGGKSGTAEELDWTGEYKYRPEDGDYRKAISFAAVLPIDDPEIVVLVMMDDPRWVTDYASQIVAPVVGNIISDIAPYLGLERDPDYDESALVTVPNAVGTSWTSVQIQLNTAGLSHKMIGSASADIVYQYPYSGTKVPAGSTVYVYTESTTGSVTTVPDTTGKTGAFASQLLKSSNLNVVVDGDAGGRVVSQSVAAGTTAEYGTVVTITTEADATDATDAADSDGAASSDAASSEDSSSDASDTADSADTSPASADAA